MSTDEDGFLKSFDESSFVLMNTLSLEFLKVTSARIENLIFSDINIDGNNSSGLLVSVNTNLNSIFSGSSI